MLTIAVLSLSVGLASLYQLALKGPALGELVVFDPARGPRGWDGPGMVVERVITGQVQPGAGTSHCVLTPTTMIAGGGSLLIEAKVQSRPPSFRVRWIGSSTNAAGGDCGRSADLILLLPQLRALAVFAGGFGIKGGRGTF